MAVMAREPTETDKRLDDLNLRVESVDRRMETGFAEMREEFRAVRSETKGEFQGIRGEMQGEFQGIRGETKGEFQGIRGEMQGEFQALRSEIGAMRSDLTHLTYSLIGTMLVGFLGTIATIITQT